ADELDEIAATCDFVHIERVYTRQAAPGARLEGRFTPEHLKRLGVDPSATPTWLCGPAGLISAVTDTYRELAAENNLHSEYFKVPSVDLDAADATGTMTFAASGASADNSG